MTREHTKRNERVIAYGGKYANFHSLHPSAVKSLGNFADQYIRLLHMFCTFQMQWVMAICLTNGDGTVHVARGAWRVGCRGLRGVGGAKRIEELREG